MKTCFSLHVHITFHVLWDDYRRLRTCPPSWSIWQGWHHGKWSARREETPGNILTAQVAPVKVGERNALAKVGAKKVGANVAQVSEWPLAIVGARACTKMVSKQTQKLASGHTCKEHRGAALLIICKHLYTYMWAKRITRHELLLQDMNCSTRQWQGSSPSPRKGIASIEIRRIP